MRETEPLSHIIQIIGNISYYYTFAHLFIDKEDAYYCLFIWSRALVSKRQMQKV